MSFGRGPVAVALCLAALILGGVCARDAMARDDGQFDAPAGSVPGADSVPDDMITAPSGRFSSARAGGARGYDADTALEPPRVLAPPTVSGYTAVASDCPPPGAASFPVIDGIAYGAPWTWQILPQGLIYHSYLAGVREPRMASVFNYQKGLGWLWDPTVGARIGLLRYGTPNSFRPDGWQLDVEGAAFPELLMSQDLIMHATDFRGGVPLTYGYGPWQFKFAFYHISSHIGDQFLIDNPAFSRVEYSRNALVFGTSYFPTDNLRLYGEVDWAFYTNGATQPWQFQFGAEYSPIFSPGFRGSPFAAINGHLRQEVAFGGAVTVQVGWQWLNAGTGTRLRAGFQYFNGKNEQYQFYNEFVQQFGIGLWYDF